MAEKLLLASKWILRCSWCISAFIILLNTACDDVVRGYYSYSMEGDLYRFPLGKPYELISVGGEVDEYWTIELKGYKPYECASGKQIAWLDSLVAYKGVFYLHSSRINVSGGSQQGWIIIDPCSKTEEIVFSSEEKKYRRLLMQLKSKTTIYKLSLILPDFINYLNYPEKLKSQIIPLCDADHPNKKDMGKVDHINLGDSSEETKEKEEL